MLRTLTAITLLLAIGACNRQPAANSAAPTNAASAARPAAPPAVNASAGVVEEAVEEGEAMAEPEQAPDPSAEEERAEGCAGEIGLPAARRLVEQCTDVSPATRSPCNTANSCAMIREEIERGCGLLEADAPAFCQEGG